MYAAKHAIERHISTQASYLLEEMVPHEVSQKTVMVYRALYRRAFRNEKKKNYGTCK